MLTKQLIKKLQELDPDGNMVIVFESEDGYVYNISPDPKKIYADSGIIDDTKEPNCIKI
jgi:hypothetical protein